MMMMMMMMMPLLSDRSIYLLVGIVGLTLKEAQQQILHHQE
jgi:hypothetical protein